MTVVSCDMREWKAPEKADIIVSELLGSFGDNELSPECLDGAQHFLKGNGKTGSSGTGLHGSARMHTRQFCTVNTSLQECTQSHSEDICSLCENAHKTFVYSGTAKLIPAS